MESLISHDRSRETSPAKVRWFCKLTSEERLDYLAEIVNLALAHNPELSEQKDVEQAGRRVQIIRKT
jgi:hypothetical protein